MEITVKIETIVNCYETWSEMKFTKEDVREFLTDAVEWANIFNSMSKGE